MCIGVPIFKERAKNRLAHQKLIGVQTILIAQFYICFFFLLLFATIVQLRFVTFLFVCERWNNFDNHFSIILL